MSTETIRLATLLLAIPFILSGQPARAEQPASPPEIASAPPPEILRDISQRQTELAVLELEIKKAELKKKLFDLQASGPPAAIASPREVAPPRVEIPLASSDIVEDKGISVKLIHKVDGRLAARVVHAGGETQDVKVGAPLGDGFTVAEIRADGVTVRRSAADVSRVPAAPVSSSGK
jgi:type IV pilus biogenesis protein PilP